MIVSDDREQTESADEAARWLVRLDAGPLSRDEQRAFEDWQALHPTHQKLFQEMTDLWSSFDRLPEKPRSIPIADPEVNRPRPSHGWGRQALHWASSAALAASVVLAAMWVMSEWPVLTSDHHTAAGELRTVTLDDGSTIYLNVSSALSVDFTASERRVTLVKGDAVFAVSPDPSRPFRVEAGEVTATALGTEFLVRRDPAHVAVTVLDHHVSVAASDSQAGTSERTELTLEPGQQISYEPSTGLSPVRQADLRSATAWRRGKIIFEGESLGSVIEELNRYHRGRIVIVDSDLRSMRVNGVFQTAEPAQVITALEQTLQIHSTRFTDYFIILHR